MIENQSTVENVAMFIFHTIAFNLRFPPYTDALFDAAESFIGIRKKINNTSERNF